MNGQLAFDFPLHEEMSLDNFIVCEGNRRPFQLALSVIEGGELERALFIHGPSGSGKTHLLQGIARRFTPVAPTFSFREVEEINPEAAASSLARRFTGAPALLLDDIDRIPPARSLHHLLWQLYNDYHLEGEPIVITSSLPPRELSVLDEHLTSRLLWGLAARIDVTGDDSRRMILQKLAADRGIILPEEVVDHLLTRLPRSIPALRTALDRICRHALETKRRITLPLAREALDTGNATR